MLTDKCVLIGLHYAHADFHTHSLWLTRVDINDGNAKKKKRKVCVIRNDDKSMCETITNPDKRAANKGLNATAGLCGVTDG